MDRQIEQKGIFNKPMTRRGFGKAAIGVAAATGLKSILSRMPCSFEEGTAYAAPDYAPQPQSLEKRELGKGEAKIGLNYPERTNLADPEVKARVDEDMQFVKEVLLQLPILGFPEIGISAQDRYKYNFPAITPGNLGSYQKERNFFFINMEETDSTIRRYLLNHEMGGALFVSFV